MACFSNGIGDYYLTEAEVYDAVDIESMKRKIMTLGSMCVDINDAWNSRYGMINGYKTLNNPVADYDHSVAIVGWDDDFSRENFKLQPKEDGAWLAQNTRGDKWGNEGFQKLVIDIYTDDFKEALYTEEISFEYPGYHTW